MSDKLDDLTDGRRINGLRGSRPRSRASFLCADGPNVADDRDLLAGFRLPGFGEIGGADGTVVVRAVDAKPYLAHAAFDAALDVPDLEVVQASGVMWREKSRENHESSWRSRERASERHRFVEERVERTTSDGKHGVVHDPVAVERPERSQHVTVKPQVLAADGEGWWRSAPLHEMLGEFETCHAPQSFGCRTWKVLFGCTVRGSQWRPMDRSPALAVGALCGPYRRGRRGCYQCANSGIGIVQFPSRKGSFLLRRNKYRITLFVIDLIVFGRVE